jgi:hypothetical protein
VFQCFAAAFEPYRTQYTPAAFADTVPTGEAMLLRLQQMHVLVAILAGDVVGTISATIHGDQSFARNGGSA